MTDEGWRGLDDDGLERLLVERWVHRGLLLGVVALCAVVTTWLGTRGVATLTDWVTVGVLVALALVATGVAYVMRREDARIHTELRRRARDSRR